MLQTRQEVPYCPKMSNSEASLRSVPPEFALVARQFTAQFEFEVYQI